MPECDLNTIQIVQGDTPRIDHIVTDSKGNKLTNLSDVSEIIFMAKTNADDPDNAAKITLKFTLGQIIKDNANSTLTMIFSRGDTESLPPQNLLPFGKILYQTLTEQFHLDMLTDRGQPWTNLEIVESGIDESIT